MEKRLRKYLFGVAIFALGFPIVGVLMRIIPIFSENGPSIYYLLDNFTILIIEIGAFISGVLAYLLLKINEDNEK